MTETAFPDVAAPPPQSPLFDLLARNWMLGAAITGIAFDRAGKLAGFALNDGRLALAPLDDPDSALSRMRVEADSGRSTIRPREKPPAPPVLTPELARGAPLLAASGVIGLVAAGRDGRLHRVTPRGQVIALPVPDGPILAIASDRGGRLALARQGAVDLHEEQDMARIASLPVPAPTQALAFADDGTLAALLPQALLLGRPEEGLTMHPLIGGSGPLIFSADGGWLAGSNGRDGLWLLRRGDGRIARIGRFRAAPSSLAFSGPAGAVFASGAFRAAGWSLKTPPWDDEATGALRTGRPGLVLIDRIAAHPTRDLIAFGAADGAVQIARAGRSEEMALRQPDGHAVTALGWSRDGLHLGIGTADGQAALVTLPPQLFK